MHEAPSDAKDNAESGPRALRKLFLLRPDVVFLNHGSFGACPRSVFDAYQTCQLELERQPVEFLGRRFNDLMRNARESLAAFVGTHPNDLVYVPNATTGLNIVARSCHCSLATRYSARTTNTAHWIASGALSVSGVARATSTNRSHYPSSPLSRSSKRCGQA